MKLICAWTVAFAAIAVTAAVDKVIDKSLASAGFNLPCLYDNCFNEMVACKDMDCQKYLACSATCISQWDKDTTVGKFDVLNCTSKCQFTYVDDAADKFMTCSALNGCIELPPIPSTCKAASAKPAKQLSVKDLDGDWWVVRGYHPVYDCYGCKRERFQAMGSDSYQWSPSYLATLVDGSQKPVSQKFEMPVEPPGQGFTFTFDDGGAINNATWWVVDKADDGSYALVYYCGNVADWNYEGGIVMAQSTSLPTSAYTKIAASFKTTVGLDLTDFCHNQVSNCSG